MSNERCSICDRDCSFLAGMDDVCLPCFDDLQLQGTGELTKRLVLAVREVNRLEVELKKLKAGSHPLEEVAKHRNFL